MFSLPLRLELESRYSLGRIRRAQPLTGGYWNEVLRLDCSRGHFVLRLSHPTTLQAGVAYEHVILQFMNAHIPQVHAPLKTGEGTTYFQHAGRIISLFPLMPGRPLRKERAGERLAAARMLAQLHQVALTYPSLAPRPGRAPQATLNWEHNPMWDWPALQTLLADWSPAATQAGEPGEQEAIPLILARWEQIVRYREMSRDWMANLAASGRELQMAPTQGDYYANNLLVQAGQISGVVDWDECGPEWLAYELGRATWEFCRDKPANRLNLAWARRFLAAYQAVDGPVPSTDFDLLLPFIRCVRIQEILFNLEQARLGQPWSPAYMLHNLLSLENLEGLTEGSF
jgi:Ser/Thr protein kinase RdoA (MazF antagonist)